MRNEKRGNDARNKDDNKKKKNERRKAAAAAFERLFQSVAQWCSQIIFNILHIFRHHYYLLLSMKKLFFFLLLLFSLLCYTVCSKIHCTSFSLENWRQRWNWCWPNSNIINIDWWKLYVDGQMHSLCCCILLYAAFESFHVFLQQSQFHFQFITWSSFVGAF